VSSLVNGARAEACLTTSAASVPLALVCSSAARLRTASHGASADVPPMPSSRSAGFVTTARVRPDPSLRQYAERTSACPASLVTRAAPKFNDPASPTRKTCFVFHWQVFWRNASAASA
jgi:hypothetical protein